MNKVELTESAQKRILEIKNQSDNQHKFLRLTVKSGGCSGFQYIFDLDDKKTDDDVILDINSTIAESTFYGTRIIAVSDLVSLNFIDGAKIDFVEELGASYFKVINPNATANCGCGASFSI